MKSKIVLLINKLDKLIARQVDEILHHARFQKLEASWRGVHYLVRQIQNSSDFQVKIKLLPMTWQEITKDVIKAIEFDQCHLFNSIYSQEFGHPGGEPYGLILGDYSLSLQHQHAHSLQEIDVLAEIAKIAAAAFAPFVCGVAPEFFGLNEFSDWDRPFHFSRHFQQQIYYKWKSLRQKMESCFVSLCLPRVLVRRPHPSENIGENKLNHYLWGTPVYQFAAVVMRAFYQTGWFTEIRGFQEKNNMGGVLTSDVRLIRAYQTSLATDFCITDQFEKTLSDFGFMALCDNQYSHRSVFYSCPSIHQSYVYSNKNATDNARLNTMLNYVLCVSRFSHYIKVMMREKIGAFSTPEDIEKFLRQWIQQYICANDSAGPELRAKQPLRRAKLQVKAVPGKPGAYYCISHLQPHLQFEKAETQLRLVTELS